VEAGDKNTCSYIVNAGLTPTAGTFQETLNYFKEIRVHPGLVQKNFIIYVTDGLRAWIESGTGDTAGASHANCFSKSRYPEKYYKEYSRQKITILMLKLMS